jgi:hypothetical protein
MQESHVTQLPDIEPLKIEHPKIQGFLIILKLQVGGCHGLPILYPDPNYVLDSTSLFIGSQHFFILQKTSGESSFATRRTRLQDTAVTKKNNMRIGI